MTTYPPVIRMQEIDSTSAYARREALEGRLCEHPMVFVARRQTSGVGRFGRSWASPIGGLWLTLAWPITGKGINSGSILDGLGLRLGVACRGAVSQILAAAGHGTEVRLKWPNDVLILGRKVLGVLTEVVTCGDRRWVLVGVGLNANFGVEQLPENLGATSTTLREQVGADIDLAAAERTIIAAVVKAMHAAEKLGLDTATLEEAREHLHGIGQPASVSLPDGGRMTGLLTGLNEHGQAVFEVEGKPFTPPLGAVIMMGS